MCLGAISGRKDCSLESGCNLDCLISCAIKQFVGLSRGVWPSSGVWKLALGLPKEGQVLTEGI